MKSIALVALFGLAPALPAQDPLVRGEDATQAQKKEIARLEQWPKLAGEAAKAMKLDIERLRKSNTPEMGEQADAALTAAGAGVVPELLPILGKERNLDARGRIQGVLDKITAAEHTRLLAPFFADKSREIRTWTLHRCALFPDGELKAPAEAALAAAQAAKVKDPKTEGADDEIYAAALCATAAGSHQALDLMAKNALEEWGERGVELRTALEAVRDEEATTFAVKLAQDADRSRKVAGLNLLAGCGTKAAIGVVRPLLDNTDNSIRVAAINAMRGIVDGDPPIAKLPVFEAIELAKKWKERAY